MDFFDHPGTACHPRQAGKLFARLFFVGVGWLAMDTGLRRYDGGRIETVPALRAVPAEMGTVFPVG